ncbi:conjugal transfer protein [Pseudoclavibacter chungangensis]|uniref:conjugal transfer protein n=1 Tax=Pseudoclavibacter chungangensis TaxID=587635 RepID=UPI0015CA855C
MGVRLPGRLRGRGDGTGGRGWNSDLGTSRAGGERPRRGERDDEYPDDEQWGDEQWGDEQWADEQWGDEQWTDERRGDERTGDERPGDGWDEEWDEGWGDGPVDDGSGDRERPGSRDGGRRGRSVGGRRRPGQRAGGARGTRVQRAPREAPPRDRRSDRGDDDGAVRAVPRRRAWHRRATGRGDTTDAPRHETGPARTSAWTAGRARATTAQAVVLWLAIACGPIALVGSLLAPEPTVAPPAVVQEPVGPSPVEVRAGAVATGFVGAWLAATRDDRAGLDAFMPGLDVTTTVATPSRDLALAAVETVGGRDVVSVTVAATVLEGGTDGASAWHRRYYLVAVEASETGPMTVLAAPALVPAPETDTAARPWGVELASSDPVVQATGLFLTSLLTGGSDLDRFIAPGAPIAPVVPAPYVTVQLAEVRSGASPSPAPADGASVQVSAELTAVTATESTRSLQYWLTLSARDGRWEVASIDLAPGPVEPVASTSQPTASAPADGTDGPHGTAEPEDTTAPAPSGAGDDTDRPAEPETTTETEP